MKPKTFELLMTVLIVFGNVLAIVVAIIIAIKIFLTFLGLD